MVQGSAPSVQPTLQHSPSASSTGGSTSGSAGSQHSPECDMTPLSQHAHMLSAQCGGHRLAARAAVPGHAAEAQRAHLAFSASVARCARAPSIAIPAHSMATAVLHSVCASSVAHVRLHLTLGQRAPAAPLCLPSMECTRLGDAASIPCCGQIQHTILRLAPCSMTCWPRVRCRCRCSPRIGPRHHCSNYPARPVRAAGRAQRCSTSH
jgi:hypothetical protein